MDSDAPTPADLVAHPRRLSIAEECRRGSGTAYELTKRLSDEADERPVKRTLETLRKLGVVHAPSGGQRTYTFNANWTNALDHALRITRKGRLIEASHVLFVGSQAAPRAWALLGTADFRAMVSWVTQFRDSTWSLAVGLSPDVSEDDRGAVEMAFTRDGLQVQLVSVGRSWTQEEIREQAKLVQPGGRWTALPA